MHSNNKNNKIGIKCEKEKNYDEQKLLFSGGVHELFEDKCASDKQCQF